jgi:hypothetical protein
MSTGAGGVLVTKVKVRSSKIVISTGMMVPRWALGAGVVLLAEVHDRDAVGAERGTDGRRGRGLPAGIWILTTADDLLLGHGSHLSLGIRRRPSPGETPTHGGRGGPHTQLISLVEPAGKLRGAHDRRRSELRDLTELELDRGLATEDVDEHLDLQLVLVDLDDLAAEKSANGPSLTRTVSPISYSRPGLALACGASSSSAFTVRKFSTSLRGSGVGLLPGPTNPVTPGVLRITYQRVVVEAAADQQVAGEHLLLDDDLLAVA